MRAPLRRHWNRDEGLSPVRARGLLISLSGRGHGPEWWACPRALSRLYTPSAGRGREASSRVIDDRTFCRRYEHTSRGTTRRDSFNRQRALNTKRVYRVRRVFMVKERSAAQPSAAAYRSTAPLTTVGGRWHVTKVILRSLGLCLSCWGSAVRTRVLHVTAPIWQLFAGGTRSACERVYVLAHPPSPNNPS